MASATIEEYLEMVYRLDQKGGPVIGARLAEAVGVSAPTVTQTLKRMVKDGYVRMNARKEIALTPAGMEQVRSIQRRHRLAELLLTDILGFDWLQAHVEAVKFQHVLSPEVASAISRTLGDPLTCPHGNPIPGNIPDDYTEEALRPLAAVPVGETVIVRRITEDGEEEPQLLGYYYDKGLLPGAILIMREQELYAGTVTVEKEGNSMALGVRAAQELLVAPV
jgi:DtxR family transcriptional regulator, Mn-dependent transcriptional regulator